MAFVDDDVVAHPGWLHELVKGFEDASVACVTGRLIPQGPGYGQSPEAIRLYLGERALTTWTMSPEPGCYQMALSSTAIGFGCNMAFRRSFLEDYCPFPEDLGNGSIIGAQDENYMFLQVLKHGFRIFHTPFAVVTHFFDDDVTQQKSRLKQIRAATVAVRLKLLWEEKGYRLATLNSMFSGLMRLLRKSWRNTAFPGPPELLSPSEIFLAHLRGFWVYWQSRRQSNELLYSQFKGRDA